MISISEHDKKILDSKTDIELAQIWIDLNKYNCPNSLFHHKDEAKRLSELSVRSYEKNNIVSLIMKYISEKIGYYVILKLSNEKELSDEEFEDFWKGNYENDIYAKERDSIRALKKIAQNLKIYDEVDWNMTSKDVVEKIEELIR